MGRKQNTFVSAEERAPQDRKLTRPGALTIVLLNPRIPQNTGSIARLCAGTGSRLDIINPFFKIDDTKLKRAGLDYWPLLDVRVFPDFAAWREANPTKRMWLVEVGGTKLYTEAQFEAEDCLVFGDEQDGIAPSLLAAHPDQHLRVPQDNVRSFNLAMTAGIVLFEGLRQLNWLGLED
ncbi:MAG: tRNA (cytidine(34)-2'-O)-methyltransferase [Bdellovibrionales bacterium]|nr:tRNA (cytidine(34)-2'-O)-methyltransferase [Bdellovibrionales bacterium]